MTSEQHDAQSQPGEVALERPVGRPVPERATIRVYRLDDMEWWAGESLAACVEEGRRQCGAECYPDDPDEQHELSDEEMQRLTFVDLDGSKRTFAEELERRVAAGEQFPQSFAAEDW